MKTLAQIGAIWHIQGTKRLATNMLWLGSAQVLGRVVRLGSSIILARLLTPDIFGQVAIILTSFEIISIFIRRITSAPLIKMQDSDFISHLASANGLNWFVCLSSFVALSLLSGPIAIYYQDMSIVKPMILMATSFLLLPFGMIYATANLRNNRMRVVGRASLWQTIADSVLTAILVLCGFGIWGIVIPKVLVVLIWIGIHRYHNHLTISSTSIFDRQGKYFIKHSCAQKCRNLLHFGLMVGIGDFSLALRQNIDYLLVGYFLGVEALGVYFFAVNASLGVSLGLVQSFGTAFYSHLCHPDSENALQKYRHALLSIMLVTLPIISLQSILAPWYLPIVYGEHWLDAGALPIFILLCLSGLTRPLGEAASQLLISSGLNQLNLLCNFGFVALLTLAISLGSLWGLTTVAMNIFVCYLIYMPLFAYFVMKPTAKKLGLITLSPSLGGSL
ncbi:oligosaccharide flippase family protein [Shewanella sp. SP2S2-4]|jgi:teichuronic acid exporter|uniref:Oligosaccharide flippase family protein n=2 Tax=Shewanella TaxID=22 RepID=A0ABU9UWZ2_9GAMM|nr:MULTISPECIES: oligosaccharide flippase family protein [Shewanella]KZK70140.1 polysaccharide biosynthesis protein [Shewanella baltica]MDT3273503.1 oligosaccharide flippase family protein [Shewanella sp. SP2S2-4]MDT3281583.1 oligosaccharide flippase family protein [Shewanella sp. SP2S1-2]MDT3309416.1 oligosaccharide flippase family protein [Shewanella sp. SP1S1-4]MDT3322266.1 oligosaccharide flippase family protein [Shewanella sp. SP1S2-4]